jgi:hypothetical protein
MLLSISTKSSEALRFLWKGMTCVGLKLSALEVVGEEEVISFPGVGLLDFRI